MTKEQNVVTGNSEQTGKKIEKHRRKRRKLLKSATMAGVAAGSVPAGWTKPIVKKVVLPAHANTTCTGNIRVTLQADDVDCSLTFDSLGGAINRSCDFSDNGGSIDGWSISIDPAADSPVELSVSYDLSGKAIEIADGADFLGAENPPTGNETIDITAENDGNTGIQLSTSDCPNDGTLSFQLSGSGYCPLDVTIVFSEDNCTPPG